MVTWALGSEDCFSSLSLLDLIAVEAMDRERSPRRQNYSWLSGAPPPFAGSTGLVRQATQLHWQAPQMDLSQSSGLPCCGGGKGGQAAFSLQSGCCPQHAPVPNFVPRPALPTQTFSACCLYTRRSARHGRFIFLTRSHAERATENRERSLVCQCLRTTVPSSFRSDEFFLDTNLVGGLQLPRFVRFRSCHAGSRRDRFNRPL